MKNYYRIMLGRKSKFAPDAEEGGFVGVDFVADKDMSAVSQLSRDDFKQAFFPAYQAAHPEKNKLATGLACGALWTMCREINIGDVVLCPNGEKAYLVGDVTDNYLYTPGEVLPHRRKVTWRKNRILRVDMSSDLRGSTGAAGTVCDISNYAKELETLLDGTASPATIAPSASDSIENPAVFLLEKYLQQFLIDNWSHTVLGKDYDIFKVEEGDGTEVVTDAGRIDILAVSKNGKRLLVVELKKGRASDRVVGQLLRYMGAVQAEVAESDQVVEGVIVALEDDVPLQRALSMVPNAKFYQYEVKFQLIRK